MSAPVVGVLFDLYGTLIPPFRRQEHMAALRRCARLLGIDAEACQRGWVSSFPDRVRGRFDTVSDNFRHIAHQHDLVVDDARLSRAEQCYLEFTWESLGLVGTDTMAALDELRAAGVSMGLVTNCAPDVPTAWDASPLGPYFSFCAFSCRIGAVKPERKIYQVALDGLGIDAAQAVFVGDGSDEELSGAVACGIRAVLVRRDLSNTYDATRADVEAWSGASIHRLTEIPRLL